MNVTTKSAALGYSGKSGQAQSFGNLKRDVKLLLNQPHVRSALKEYNVTKQDIRALDESHLRFQLLSSLFKKTVLPVGYDVSQYSGLFLRAPKKSNLPNVTVTVSEADLGKADTKFFAFCVAKARDMEKLYRETIKEIGNHPLSKQKSEEITNVERQVKKDLKNYVASYQASDERGLRTSYGKIKASEMQEIKIDSRYKNQIDRLNKQVMGEISEGWNTINHREYVEPGSKK